MPRTVTAKVTTATQGPVTHPARLVEIAFPNGTLYLSTREAVTWSAQTWQASGVDVTNLRADPQGGERATVTLPNLDRSAGATVLNNAVRDSRVRVWALYGDPPYAADDPVALFDGVITAVPKVTDEVVRLECSSTRANAGGGGVPVYPYIVADALAADTVIRWGNVELTLEAP